MADAALGTKLVIRFGQLISSMGSLSIAVLSLMVFFIPSGNPPLVFANMLKGLIEEVGSPTGGILVEILIRVPDQMFMTFTTLAAGFYALYFLYAAIACLL